MASASTNSSFLRPAFSGPKRRPSRAPRRPASRSAVTAARGASSGFSISLGLAVVAWTRLRSATASSTVAQRRAPLSTAPAPEAAPSALTLGQPSRGSTRRRSERPQFSMARAAAPMFSPSWVRTRMTAGAPFSTWAAARLLRRSVPATAQPAMARDRRTPFTARGATACPPPCLRGRCPRPPSPRGCGRPR